jgi:hypothetical protein
LPELSRAVMPLASSNLSHVRRPVVTSGGVVTTVTAVVVVFVVLPLGLVATTS